MRKFRFKLIGTANVEGIVEIVAGDEIEADEKIDDLLSNNMIQFEISDDWSLDVKDTELLGSDPINFFDKNQKALPL